MSVLIVAAHPDDEVLGVGATAAMLAANGESVRCCFLSGEAEARRHRPEVSELVENTHEAQRILGLGEPIFGNFPNIRFNIVPHYELVQFIEAAIGETSADTIFTHHPQDLNDDHQHVSAACQAAARLFQRRENITSLRALYFMEVLSSTDWTFPSADAFRADTFFEIGEAGVEKKIAALNAYRGVMRDFPHSRSSEIIRALAALRGAQAGMRYAESFQTAFRAHHRVEKEI